MAQTPIQANTNTVGFAFAPFWVGGIVLCASVRACEWVYVCYALNRVKQSVRARRLTKIAAQRTLSMNVLYFLRYYFFIKHALAMILADRTHIKLQLWIQFVIVCHTELSLSFGVLVEIRFFVCVTHTLQVREWESKNRR